MRIITLNANGIRSAQRKGFFEWLAARVMRCQVTVLMNLCTESPPE